MDDCVFGKWQWIKALIGASQSCSCVIPWRIALPSIIGAYNPMTTAKVRVYRASLALEKDVTFFEFGGK